MGKMKVEVQSIGSLTVSIKCLSEPYLWGKDHLLIFLEFDTQSGGGGAKGGGARRKGGGARGGVGKEGRGKRKRRRKGEEEGEKERVRRGA